MGSDIAGLSVAMVNLIVLLTVLGAGFCVLLAFAFYRLYNGPQGDLIRELGQEQVEYMRQVRYQNRLNMFYAAREAKHNARASKETGEASTIYREEEGV